MSLAVVWLSKEKLHVEETFPELLRLPGLGRFLRTAPAARPVPGARPGRPASILPGPDDAVAADGENSHEEPL